MKKLIPAVLAATLATVTFTGCICDGCETTFKEVDRKYAESGWTAAAFYTPIIGPCFMLPVLMLCKDADYQRVLLDKPATDVYENIRWDNRFNLVCYPGE